MDYLLCLQPSSLTKVVKSFGIPAPTLRLTAGLGESRRPSSMWIVFQTTSYPRGLTSWTPSPLLLWGTHSVCPLWQSTFLLHRRLQSQSPALILSPSLPLFMGGLGGAFTPSDRRFSRLSMSLCELCVLRGGVLNSIPSLKNTPHHALAVSSHRLNMGGALAPVAASLLCPSLPPWGMGGDYSHRSVGGHPPRSPPLSEAYSSPSRSEIFNGGGSDSSDIDPESSKNSSFWGSSSSDSAVDCPSQARRASFASPTSGVAPPPGPIPLPTVAPFTLPAIKNATDYL